MEYVDYKYAGNVFVGTVCTDIGESSSGMVDTPWYRVLRGVYNLFNNVGRSPKLNAHSQSNCNMVSSEFRVRRIHYSPYDEVDVAGSRITTAE